MWDGVSQTLVTVTLLACLLLGGACRGNSALPGVAGTGGTESGTGGVGPAAAAGASGHAGASGVTGGAGVPGTGGQVTSGATGGTVGMRGGYAYRNQADLLFMIDDSSSMAPLQKKLVDQLPSFLAALKDPSTGKLADLHVAVISSSFAAAPGATSTSSVCRAITRATIRATFSKVRVGQAWARAGCSTRGRRS